MSLGGDHFGDDGLAARAPLGIARHEQVADAILAGLRQREAEPFGFGGEEFMRDLNQHPRAVTGQRICADGPAMGEVDEDFQAVHDDFVALAALNIGNHADAAGIVLEFRAV